VGSVVTSTECDTCKARHPYPGSPDQLGSDVYLDGSIAKLGSVDKRKGGLIHGVFGQTNGFAASILDRYRFHARRDQQVRGVGQRKGLRRRCSIIRFVDVWGCTGVCR
jgi:hypothetical protein